MLRILHLPVSKVGVVVFVADLTVRNVIVINLVALELQSWAATVFGRRVSYP